MVTFLFVLGRPGSGKSTAVHHILQSAHQHGWQTVRLKDYEILYDMFLKDTAQVRFRPAPFGAFDVIDFSVLDEVLEALRDQSLEHFFSEPEISEKKLVIIEFARDEYQKALETFDSVLLSNSYFLLVEADMENCIYRIQKRIYHQARQDNHYVSAEIIHAYYCRDDRLYFLNAFVHQYTIEPHKISIIENNSSYTTFIDQVDRCVLSNVLKTPLQSV